MDNGYYNDVSVQADTIGFDDSDGDYVVLTRERLRWLLPALQHFAEHGTLPKEDVDDKG